MSKLTIGSFKRSGEQGSFGHMFQHFTEDGIEVCLESCLNGYCVGLYRNQNLIGEKTCTNIEGMMEMQIAPGFSMGTGEALGKAVIIANEKLANYDPK